nr:hypothetical protein CFP56_55293 [Quercus suber]
MGFNYLHSKILALWKPVGKLDCIDLGRDYFLIRFSLQEDHDLVLKKANQTHGPQSRRRRRRSSLLVVVAAAHVAVVVSAHRRSEIVDPILEIADRSSASALVVSARCSAPSGPPSRSPSLV